MIHLIRNDVGSSGIIRNHFCDEAFFRKQQKRLPIYRELCKQIIWRYE